MGITSCGSFNQPLSFLLTAIYLIHITILIGKRDTTCLIIPSAIAGGTLPPVRFAPVPPGSTRLHSVKNEGLKATPALEVSEPFCLRVSRLCPLPLRLPDTGYPLPLGQNYKVKLTSFNYFVNPLC